MWRKWHVNEINVYLWLSDISSCKEIRDTNPFKELESIWDPTR